MKYNKHTKKLELDFERLDIYNFDLTGLHGNGYRLDRVRYDYISFYNSDKNKEIVFFTDLEISIDKGVSAEAKIGAEQFKKQLENEIERLKPIYKDEVLTAYEYFKSLE